ncbi:MAG: BrnT family toxin [candidate division NC10 bacterium]|nr:BrnT family toxin [candidate division NC10 bacterium]
MFQWDAGNTNKNVKHGVQDWEIEEALLDQRALRTKRIQVGGEVRYELLGRARTSGKYLRVIYTLRQDAEGNLLIRPISAVEMTPTQKRRYQRR